MFTESQTLEFKSIWKDDYLKTICAFANGEGGQLLIGVNDQGEIIGIDNSKQLLETLPNKINNKLGLLVDVIPHEKRPKNLFGNQCAKHTGPRFLRRKIL